MLQYCQSRKVTINGTWPNQPVHCLSFENPCLTEATIADGESALKSKRFAPPYHIAFVGRLDQNKGAELLLGAAVNLDARDLIGDIHLVGDGPWRERLFRISREHDLQVRFHGFLMRDSVFEVLKCCHILVLPSASEGFPKVLPEAWNFGCIPVVTRISAIDQYLVDGKSGFLLDPSERSVEGLKRKLSEVLMRNDLGTIADNGRKLVSKFTYEHYRTRVLKEILGG
jgi:glycosyltransferase involved in cell wall biosynthesis